MHSFETNFSKNADDFILDIDVLPNGVDFEKWSKKNDVFPEISELKPQSYNIIEVLVESGLCSGKSDARRAIEQGGVKVNDKKVVDFDFETKCHFVRL